MRNTVRRVRWGSPARLGALATLAALALHELGCLVDPRLGSGPGCVGTVLACLAFTVLAGRLLVARMRGAARSSKTRCSSARREIALLATAITLLFLAEEVAEGILQAKEAFGCLDLLGSGAWWIFPVALALAPFCRLGDRWFGRLEAIAAAGGAEAARRLPPVARLLCTDVGWIRPPRSPLAFGIARRPPPPGFG